MVKIKTTESNFPNVNGPTVITKKIGSKEYFFIVRTYQGKEEYLSIGMNRQPKWVTNFNFASTYPDAGAAQDAYDTLMKNYRESAGYRYWDNVFEKKIPQCMRYKEFSIEGDILYWITQDEFDDFDLSHFIDALEDSPLKKAFVILRDDSTYNFRKDLRNGKGTMVDLTQNNYIIRNYRESLNKKTEAIFDIKQLYKLGASDGDMYDDTGKTLCIKHRKNVRQIIDYLESCGLKQVWDCFSAWEVKKKTNGKPGYCVMPVENDDDFYGFDARLFIYHPVLESVEPDNSIKIKEDLMIPGTNIMLEAGDRIRIFVENKVKIKRTYQNILDIVKSIKLDLPQYVILKQEVKELSVFINDTDDASIIDTKYTDPVDYQKRYGLVYFVCYGIDEKNCPKSFDKYQRQNALNRARDLIKRHIKELFPKVDDIFEAGHVEFYKNRMIYFYPNQNKAYTESYNESASVEERAEAGLIPSEILKPGFDGQVLLWCVDRKDNFVKYIIYRDLNKFKVCNYDKFNPRFLNARDVTLDTNDIEVAIEMVKNSFNVNEIIRIDPVHKF